MEISVAIHFREHVINYYDNRAEAVCPHFLCNEYPCPVSKKIQSPIVSHTVILSYGNQNHAQCTWRSRGNCVGQGHMFACVMQTF